MTKKRVLWLLNDSTLRAFEIEQMNRLGITEVFLPKSFPFDERSFSADVTYDQDQKLEIPKECLEVLNNQDWYAQPSSEAWVIANKYFDIAVIGLFSKQIQSVIKNFNGAIVLRVFGLSEGYSYSRLIREICGDQVVPQIKKCGRRFWLGIAHKHLSGTEDYFLSSRTCFLPVGLELKQTTATWAWAGSEKYIFFVCPNIGTSQYFSDIYKKFTTDFSGFQYRIGGVQPIRVSDNSVLGFVTKEVYDKTMMQSRVMFYHAIEPNYNHYHPFAAITAGLPLVFMAGGVLDRMGGEKLSGRCKTTQEARLMIEKILSDDWELIERIRHDQAVLLESMKTEDCAEAWCAGFSRISSALDEQRIQEDMRPIAPLKKRIAIIIPSGCRGSDLRGGKLLAQALSLGSQQYGEPAEIIFAHLDVYDLYTEDDFSDLEPTIQTRAFKWKVLDAGAARRAMRYAGHENWEPQSTKYAIPDDEICQLLDCNLWIFISDCITIPLLPIRPVVLMVYDYLQRYIPVFPHGADQAYLEVARKAEMVLVTTEFTRQNALQYVGLEVEKVHKVPMLVPEFCNEPVHGNENARYFVWATNPGFCSDSENALKALQIYYEELDGMLDCYVTGVAAAKVLGKKAPRLKDVAELLTTDETLRNKVRWKGEQSDRKYRRLLAEARFLWHLGGIDHGTFSVVEAAVLGVPSLSSDYPEMREIDRQFNLGLSWMSSCLPQEMAKNLKNMETEALSISPKQTQLKIQKISNLAADYWKVVRECL